MIKKVYSFIYYYVYRSIRKNDKSTAVGIAAMVFATIEGFNILVIFSFIKKILDYNVYEKLGKLLFVFIFILLLILNLAIIYYKSWYKDIINKYEDFSDEVRKMNWKITLSYMLVSFLLVLIIPPVLASL
ncbi:hypothetical protein FF125_00350 [Aureibaculum algae]|uniref:Uncharacterized protein n=1 Tax=Aureibaculum algae TaxID=2584122 RepID=A0A5B7TP91_9FLAO|nr:hypothetical protein [Aureibaculum algae]QCX36956.1 hypothetical protein FF125_00350 [Aureibaculum algae]